MYFLLTETFACYVNSNNNKKTRILHFEQLHVSQIVSCLHVSAYFIGV